MLTTVLNATYLRQTYLRGIDLGQAWTGTGADLAIERLLHTQAEIIQACLGVVFYRKRILTYPEPGLVLGVDYDLHGVPLAYESPPAATQSYMLRLPFPNVHAIERVRLYEGLSTDLVPVPVFETISMAAIEVSAIDGMLRFPASLVTTPELAESWAVDYTIGFGRIPYDVAEWMALGVAIQVLSMAGSAADLSHGLAGESLTHDGIREEVTYGGQDGTGIYGGTIRVLQTMRDAIDVSAFRMRYQGVTYPTW